MLSNLDKVMYPATGFTKGQVIEYYRRVAPYILPHLRDRPVTLKRFPDGVGGEHFYEKNAPASTPEWVATFPVPKPGGKSATRYILINDLPTLVWLANMANLELHPFLSRAPRIDVPTMVVFDLDPGEGADILRACEAALLVKGVLDRLRLRSLVKVSGSKGIHLHVPLNCAINYRATRAFAESIARLLEQARPDLIVSSMAKAKRTGKVLIDWSQNSEHKSTVAVYSLRAVREQPFVAMAVRWSELKAALEKEDRDALFFTPEAVLERLERQGDFFAAALKLKQSLPAPFPELGASARRRENPGTVVSLEEYRRKRDFSKTPEPPPAGTPAAGSGEQRLFVIQKHAARRLHYDPVTVIDLESLPDAPGGFIEPMLAAPVAELPDDPSEWLYEVKLDGYRCLAVKDEKEVRLFSRNRSVLNSRFPRIARALQALPPGTAIDGEIVALDHQGRPSFSLLQRSDTPEDRIYFYAFDLLAYRGKSLIRMPLEDRRKQLAVTIARLPAAIRASEDFTEPPDRIVAAARELGLEGIIAKRRRSRYEPGKRTGEWLKYKINRSEEFVVGGYTRGRPFDALIVGQFDQGKLLFAAKVRNGFVSRTRMEVAGKLRGLITERCPFANLPEKRRTPWALTESEMKKCVWVEPRLVAQIEFTEWTPDRHLRQAKFVGLRDDKDARDVTRHD